MGNLRAVVTIASICFAAACGDDGGSSTIDAPKIIDAPIVVDGPPDAYVPDAPNYDFSCYQNAAPTTATATVQVTGLAQEITFAGGFSLIPSTNVTIKACKGNCNGANDLGDSAATGTSGMYTSASATTGGVPLDAYLIATKPGDFRTNNIYPASPLTKNEAGVPVIMLTNTQIGLLGMAGIDQNDGNGMFAVLATDCATPPVPVAGAVVTVTQNGTMAGDAPQDLGAIVPQAAGVYAITNVLPGATTVSASYNGMTFRAHVVSSIANQITTTQVKPGF